MVIDASIMIPHSETRDLDKVRTADGKSCR